MRIAICLVVALAAASACSKKSEEKKAEPTSGSSGSSGSANAMAGSGSAGSAAAMTGSAGSADSAAGSGSAATTMAHHAGNCPSTVADSTTKAEIKDKSVVVTISSTNKDAQLAIQKRTDELLAEKRDQPATSVHDQTGAHGGVSGICPVYLPQGAKWTQAKADKGVAITITPKDHVDELKNEIDARIAKAADWVKDNIKSDAKGNQGGTGGGKNNEGMNHSGSGDAKGIERKKGGGKGTGGGKGKGTGKGTGGGM